MINKDYILRIAEDYGKIITIMLGLRQRNQHEEALNYLDNLFMQTVGLSSNFINSLSEETLQHIFSPLGKLNTQTCLWAASLLKEEGAVYADMGNTAESYHRYSKSLYLLIATILTEPIGRDSEFIQVADELIEKLAPYELSMPLKEKLFAYYEYAGRYDKAENVLFELLDAQPINNDLIERGKDFYQRLLKKNESDLQAGNFSYEEIEEGLEDLQKFPNVS